MSKQIWPDTPTSLDLNGPTMSIVTQPSSTTVNHRATATFTGIATATFPAGITAAFDGVVSYQWYDQTGALGISTQWTGQTSNTLTILDAVSPDFNGKQYYFIAEYVPASVDGTGNAINEPVTSNSASLTVRPGMSIVTQPSNVTAVINNNTTITAIGQITDESQGVISYQWLVGGSPAPNGTTQTTSSVTTFSSTYTSDTTVVIPDDAVNVKIRISGGAGGYGGSDSNGGGGGGGSGRSGTFTLPDGGRTLDLFVGPRGANDDGNTIAASSVSSGGIGGQGYSSGSGGGGAAGSFVYDRLSGTYIIAAGGGGGGGGGSYNDGGDGGGNAGDWQAVGGGLSGFTGGADGGDSNGLDGGGGGAGGGGYRGGSGGSRGQDNPPPPPPPPPPPSGGGGGGKIICKKLAELGYFDKEMNEADQRFALFLKNDDHRAYYGYLTWAQTVVELMDGGGSRTVRMIAFFWERREKRRVEIQKNIVSYYMNALARPWAKEMAYRMGAKGYEKSNPAGKLMMDIGLPLCRKIGKTQSNKKMNPSVKVAVIWGTTTVLLIGVTTISTIDLLVNKVKGLFQR
jgi:hypothetical protein